MKINFSILNIIVPLFMVLGTAQLAPQTSQHEDSTTKEVVKCVKPVPRDF